uniref:Uncharacterized protein n=1 Tax=viral metagenome TaxID=1070528 RepID=A0A6C0DDI0_9ZZZZ
MNSFREYIIIALLVAILLLQLFNIKSSREGFQTATPQQTSPVSFDPADYNPNSNTCAIMKALREQIVKMLNKATLEQNEQMINQMTDSLKMFDIKLADIKC